MTERVRKMGAFDTAFQNPHGLDSDEHFTTTHDLAIIAAEALKNDTFKKISSTYKYSFKIGDETRTVVNHNKLLKIYDGCIGVKTGFTKKSGRCLVSAAEKDGVTLVAVTLDDPDDWIDHKNMLDYGFTKLESVKLNKLIKLPNTIPTISSDGASVNIKLDEDRIVKFVDDKIDYTIDLPLYITKDVKRGEKLGEVTIIVNDREDKIDIVATNDVKIKKTTRRFL